MFRVGLDLRATEAGFKAHYGRGTWRYVSQLEKALFNLKQDDISFRKLNRKDLSARGLQEKLLNCAPCGRQTLEGQLFLSSRLKKLNIDAVHFFAHVDAPSFPAVPQILSVLDLIPLKFKDLYTVSKGKWRFEFARKLENTAIKNAKGIITISECSKRDIVELLGIDEQKIFVTPLAVSSEFSPRELSAQSWIQQQNKEREHFVLPKSKPLILYVGGIDARKNVFFLLDVFAEISRKNQQAELVLAGAYKADRDFPALLKQIKRLEIETRVRLLGFVPDSDLAKLYRACTCSVFPSLYEGFGFPVLESMACGVPVFAGKNSSIPEVVGSNYPLLTDGDKDQWVREIESLIEEQSLQIKLAEKGIERAKSFSWEKTAKDTLEAYKVFGESIK